MPKMVGFLESNPRLCIAAFNSLGSTRPVPSVSKRLKASFISSISSSVRPGLFKFCEKHYIYLSYCFFYYF
jgi:hypothetical protein